MRSSSSTGPTALDGEPPTSAELQPTTVWEQPIKEENKTSPPPPSQLMVSFSVWGATNSGTYKTSKGLCFPALGPGSSAGLWQRRAHTAQVPAEAGGISAHPGAWADGGVG